MHTSDKMLITPSYYTVSLPLIIYSKLFLHFKYYKMYRFSVHLALGLRLRSASKALFFCAWNTQKWHDFLMNSPLHDSFAFLCVYKLTDWSFYRHRILKSLSVLTLLLGINMTRADVHSWTGFCDLSLPCYSFLSSSFPRSFLFMSLSCIPSAKYFPSKFIILAYLKMNRKFLLACKSLYSPCQSLLTLLALDDWLSCLSLYLSLCLSLFLSWVASHADSVQYRH